MRGSRNFTKLCRTVSPYERDNTRSYCIVSETVYVFTYRRVTFILSKYLTLLRATTTIQKLMSGVVKRPQPSSTCKSKRVVRPELTQLTKNSFFFLNFPLIHFKSLTSLEMFFIFSTGSRVEVEMAQEWGRRWHLSFRFASFENTFLFIRERQNLSFDIFSALLN